MMTVHLLCQLSKYCPLVDHNNRTQAHSHTHLHAHTAHHLVGGGQITVCGKGSRMAWLQLGMVQILDIACNQVSVLFQYERYLNSNINGHIKQYLSLPLSLSITLLTKHTSLYLGQ